MSNHPLRTRSELERLAALVGTPFYFYDAAVIAQRIALVQEQLAAPGIQARYALKACSAHLVLKAIAKAGLWIDAVSGNEVLRAKRAGFAMGSEPPVVMLTADVFRDNALAVVREEGVLPNIGSPGQLRELAAAGYRGPIGLRVNPGFGHGHVQACDTGGPSSKHGVWIDEAERHVGGGARRAGLPSRAAARARRRRAADRRAVRKSAAPGAGLRSILLPHFPDCTAGQPRRWHPALLPRPRAGSRTWPRSRILRESRKPAVHARRARHPGRDRAGRFFVAPSATLVARVTDVKLTQSNEKGKGQSFVMVDAGFAIWCVPAMYGSFHRIAVLSDEPDRWHRWWSVVHCASPATSSRATRARPIEPRGCRRRARGDLVRRTTRAPTARR
jgi:diaminopimelate decarboxylase